MRVGAEVNMVKNGVATERIGAVEGGETKNMMNWQTNPIRDRVEHRSPMKRIVDLTYLVVI